MGPTKLAVELGKIMGHNIDENQISVAHRLPNRSKTKDRMIITFVRRETRDKIYRSKNKLAGKTSNNLPSVAQEFGKSINNAAKIYINESLTTYRKKIFGQINEFRRNNQWKHIWTVSGKILIRETDSSRIHTFEQFNDFTS